jgi:predicted esterase YcpF (UPF0227 family)
LIIYIHGFASAGNPNKLLELFPEPFFNKGEVVSPSLPVSPLESIKMLNGMIDEGSIVMGCSLGGFYASYLASTNKNVGKALLINPATNPSVRMARYLGKNVNYKTQEEFDWTENHLAELKKLESEMGSIDWEETFISIGKDDDLTDSNDVMEWFGCPEVSVYDCGHRVPKEIFEEMVTNHFL